MSRSRYPVLPERVYRVPRNNKHDCRGSVPLKDQNTNQQRRKVEETMESSSFFLLFLSFDRSMAIRTRLEVSQVCERRLDSLAATPQSRTEINSGLCQRVDRRRSLARARDIPRLADGPRARRVHSCTQTHIFNEAEAGRRVRSPGERAESHARACFST